MNNLIIISIIIVLSLVILYIYTNKNEQFQNNNIKKTFDDIYKNKTWGEEGGGSGPGSEISVTYNTVDILFKIIKENNIKTVIDAPCGSCVWTKNLLQKLKENNIKITYYGYDIADEAINNAKENMLSFNDYHKVYINNGNLLNINFPQADLFLCRDTLQHLSETNIFSALNNIKKSNSKIYLLGGYLSCGGNININTGDYFDINYLLEPYNLIPDVIYLDSILYPKEPNKYLFSFNRLDIKK